MFTLYNFSGCQSYTEGLVLKREQWHELSKVSSGGSQRLPMGGGVTPLILWEGLYCKKVTTHDTSFLLLI